MEKESKKRKKHSSPGGGKAPQKKKVRFSNVVDKAPDSLWDEDAAASPEHGSLSSLRESISAWMQQQAESNQADLSALLEQSDNLDAREEDINIAKIERPLREVLRGYTETEKRKSIKFECEWRKCKYMSGTERKYFMHVESHAEITLDTRNGSYACEWDLCDFITQDEGVFIGHVHYHAYHTKLKVHGASIHMLMETPSCNNDSRVRNTIANRPVTFRCDWDGCEERINKAMNFFHHVGNHVTEQYEPGKKSNKVPIACRWSLCKLSFRQMGTALRHVRAHTTEREIGCYNCGTLFWSRKKYIEHCVRQIEISQRKYQCPVCDRSYATKALLNNHFERHDKPHECVLCPLKFSSAGVLAQHMAQRHIKQRNFKCQRCEYCAFNRKDLMVHMRKHDETKVFRCEEFGCNVAFRSELSLKKHISWHYNLPATVYACHLCDEKRYSATNVLSKHLQFAHGLERPPGHWRYRYKADSDGVFRLASYVEQKRKTAQTNEAPNHTAVPTDEAGNNVEVTSARKRKSKPSSQLGNATEKSDTDYNGAGYTPVKGNPTITSLKPIGLHQFSVELNIEPVPNLKQDSTPKPQAAAVSVATEPKDVKDFKVTERYLREQNLIKFRNLLRR
ncbi:histone H4 transcription factor [Anopheles marshallii]|uniref:histone H4 transcription factor n=1 Tax=Anopheles marshallii TaxID=1521116 RepID=UPI00237AF487|nr:histone H4 transcription factor [Anopheles marshallii]